MISKETLERAEERMQYFKGHTFVLLKVYNFVDTGLGFFFFNPIQFFSSSREGGGGGGGGEKIHRHGHFLNNTLGNDVIVLVSMAFNFYNFYIFSVQNLLAKLSKCMNM